MKFKREDLLELLDGSFDDFKLIKNKIVDHSRWSVIHDLIFQYKDKFYKTSYSVGATESQDETPWQYDDDEIECQEVVPTEKVVTVYVPASNINRSK